MDEAGKEVKMTQAEQGRHGGLTPDEVREINRPGGSKSKLNRVANVLAASLTAAAGVGLAGVAEEALRNAPPAITQKAPEQDPLNRKPPEGVVWPASQGDAFQSKDALVEPVLKKRLFLPRVLNNVSQAALDAAERPPLHLREFGAPERGVIMRNRVEQGGGNPAYVEMGDRELWENLLYLREEYGRPDLRVEVTFYSSWNLLDRTRGIPDYNPRDRSTFGLILWESYAGNNGTFRTGGGVLFRYREADKTIEWHIVLPETLPGKIPTKRELESVTVQFLSAVRGMFWTNEDRSTTVPLIRPGDSVALDMRNHPEFVYDNGRLQRSALWIRMETIPTSGGK